jgi:glycosyltransferase involved in cell wall biosynthesis
MLNNSIIFSVIIPVYNRPDEVKELLDSLCKQTIQNFELIIVEDGSSNPCEEICKEYSNRLSLRYFYKSNSGPGNSRNFGSEKAQSGFLIFFDSDCIIPERYFELLTKALDMSTIECFGGPDRSHPSFTAIQKAISFTMTSFITTGGIRGGDAKITRFYPRSFNMGFSRKVYQVTKGYASEMRFGEDLDLSMRIEKEGFHARLIPEAYVYHKRRTDFKKFFKQIFNSGIARIHLSKRHPGSLKLTHLLPSAFVCFALLSLISMLYSPLLIIPLLVYTLLVFNIAAFSEASIKIGFLAVVSIYVQMFAYGIGFFSGFWNTIVLKKQNFKAYEKTFYQ